MLPSFTDSLSSVHSFYQFQLATQGWVIKDWGVSLAIQLSTELSDLTRQNLYNQL